MKNHSLPIIAAAVLCLTACGTKKAIVSDTATKSVQEEAVVNKNTANSSLPFVQMVNDRKVYSQNIVADMNFSASMGDKDVSLPGALRMRRNKVVRLQLFVPILGTEVGRLEFTPDYVLVVDRIHKQYVKGDYNQLDFLRDNGLNFYSLQALFWNELFIPGTTRVGEGDLSTFTADTDEKSENVPIRLQNGRMSFLWNTSRENGQINEADVTYTSPAQGKSVLTWKYADFKPIGSKMFPASQVFSFLSQAVKNSKKVTVELKMDGFKTTDNWDAETTLSSKYKQVDAKDVLGKLLSM